MSDVHPDTLTKLKGGIRELKELADLVPDEAGDELEEAANELRSNFPAVDDLTLAAFAGYIALTERDSAVMMTLHDPSLGVPLLGGAAAYAKMALHLAGDLEPAEVAKDEPSEKE